MILNNPDLSITKFLSGTSTFVFKIIVNSSFMLTNDSFKCLKKSTLESSNLEINNKALSIPYSLETILNNLDKTFPPN